MIKKLLSLFITLLCLQGFSQSDNCSTATVITPNATCIYTAGTSAGATGNLASCSNGGVADDDVWYKFTATQTSMQITVSPSAGYDAVLELFSGTCASLTDLSCADHYFAGGAETINKNGLTVGAVYYFRVFDYDVGSGSSTFSVCLTAPTTTPANDACANATPLTVNATCVTTAGTSFQATTDYTSACDGTPDDDVWYTFVANDAQQVITVAPSANMDAVFEILTGTCGSFTSIACVDAAGTGATETINQLDFIPGTTYYVRVYDFGNGNGGFPFTICVSGKNTTGDEPCTAFTMPAVTSDCNYLTISNTNATATSAATAPTPSACAGGSGAQIGGYSTTTSHDVWFAITVPANGNLFITSEPIGLVPATAITDGVMALYSGACSSLTQIACSDDYPTYAGTANDHMPNLAPTGLTPGSIVYLRYWGFGSATGNFGLCVSSPTNDACSTASSICNLNGYKATTNGYSPDRPSNMRGDAEFGATYAYLPGSATSYTAAFGMGGTWGSGQPATYTTTNSYDVEIDNNSWVKFTAAATSATFSITVGDCFSTGGIQMQIFSGTNCTNFLPVSDFQQGSTGFVLTANNTLVVGQSYYLMIDGFGTDICSYTITANSGVQVPTISATPSTICSGDSTKIKVGNAAAGSTFIWEPDGQITDSITVAPGTNITYSCQVISICGDKQTLSKAITVNALPTVQINGASSPTLNVCAGTTTTLTATGATTYTWSPSTGLSAATGSVVTITPTTTTNATYTVTGTNASGCKSTATVTVKGLALPTFSVTNAHPNTCSGQKDTLTVVPTPAGTYTYSWSTGASTFSINPTINANATFTTTVTDANNCKSSLTTSVTVLTLPAVGSNTATICTGLTATLTATGTASTYTWSPAATLSSATGASVTATPTVPTNYTITGTAANGCVNTNTTTINVNPTPSVTVNSAMVCAGTPVTLIAHNATTYTWSTSQGGTSISVTPTVTTSYTVTGTNGNNCTNTAVSTVSVNPVPTLTTAPTIAPSNCGASTGSITAIGVSGSGSLSYTWTNGSNAVVGNSQDINNMPAGTYNVLVADANCSSTFGPYSITNPGSPAAPSITTNTTTACVGQIITVSASSGTTTPTYTWTGPGGYTTTNQSFTLSPTSPTQVNQTGVYAVAVTLAGCTSSSATVALTVNPLPVVSATPANNPYCAGATVNLNGSSASSYTWSGPGSYTSSVQSPQITNSTTLTTGIYTLTVTDANGCINFDTAKVDVNVTPVLSGIAATNYTLCQNQTLQLNSVVTPTTATVLWSGPNTFSSSVTNPSIPNITTAASGTYSITSILGSCSSSTNTLNITVNPTPAATASIIGSSTVCSGNDVVLQGGAAGNSYSWNGPAGTSTQQNYTLTAAQTSATGTYTLVVTNSFNCKDSATVPLTVNQTPSITSYTSNAVNNTICNGSPIQLNATATPTTATIQWQWSGPNGYSSSIANPVITPTVTGTYTIIASITPGNCQNTGLDTVRVTVNPIPTVTANVNGNSTVCSGNTIALLGNPSGYSSYSWSGPVSYTSNLQNPQITSTTTLTTGAYTLTVTDNGCSNQDITNVTVNQTPTITSYSTDAANNTICQGQNIQLNAAATPASAQIIWVGPGGYSSPPQSTTISPTVSGTYTVSAIVTPGNCLNTGLDTIHITVNPKPVATASISSTNSVVCSGNTINLVGGNSGYTGYSWTGPAGYVSSNQSNTLTNVQANQSGIYTLIVTNSFACKDTAVTSQLNVNPTPANAVSANVKTCTGGTLTVNATGTGTINWYSDAALTNLVYTGATFNPTVPSGTTNIYYVVVTSTNNCQSAISTSVSVGNYNVQATASANVYTGNAPLTVNFLGQIIGSTTTAYSWVLGDNATSVLQNPSHIYNTGGDYVVTLSGTDSASSCASTATLTIHVIDEMIIVIPNVFTPNGDNINDEFFVTTTSVKSIEGFIMNRWGQLLFEWTGLNAAWDGTAPNGHEETDGTYFYVIKATSFSNKTQEFKGFLTLIR